MARVRIEVPVEHKPTAGSHHQGPTEHHPNQPQTPTPQLPIKKWLIIGGVILGIFFVINLMQERNRLQQELENKGGDKQVSQIVSVLAKSVELPTDEVPESRIIEDASKFTEQNPSLSDIKNGDMLLFFPKSQKVVVYRPTTKKAVVVVKLAQPSGSQEAQPAQNSQLP